MSTLLKILWHIPLLGFLNAFINLIVGGLLIITVVGMPLGMGLIQYSRYLLSPWSREMKQKIDPRLKDNELWSIFGIFVRIVYFPFSLIIAAFTLVEVTLLIITFFGRSMAIDIWKTLPVVFNPLGKVVGSGGGV